MQEDRLSPALGHGWKLLEILLRRPSVQTTCSGQCRCTVVCTLVRLGKGQQRHGRLGTKCAVSEERTAECSFFMNLISSVSLHRFCKLGTKKPSGTLPGDRTAHSREDRLVRPRGLLTWSVIGERDRVPISCVKMRETPGCMYDGCS